MQFLVSFRPKEKYKRDGMPADFAAVESQEQARTRELYADGHLREVWAVEPKGSGAVVLFEASSADHLKQIIDTFPLVKADYADFQIWQLGPHPAFTSHPDPA